MANTCQKVNGGNASDIIVTICQFHKKVIIADTINAVITTRSSALKKKVKDANICVKIILIS